jgi:tetratricopeptide (TPR) repeat protein
MDRKSLIYILILFSFAVLSYVQTLDNGFLWDDYYLVENNSYIRDFSHLDKIFSSNIGRGAGKTYHFYRPIQIFSYLIDYAFWGTGAFGYHLTNVLLHALCAVFIFVMIRTLLNETTAAFMASLLHCVHPVHVGAVAYVSGRADLLVCLFTVICVVFFLRYLYDSRPYDAFFCVLFFAAALLSKENAMIVPFALLAVNRFKAGKTRTRLLVSLCAVDLAYIAIRFTFFESLLPHLNRTSALTERLPGFFAAIAHYLRLLILPLNLRVDYGKELFFWADPAVISGVLLFLVLVFMLTAKRRYRRIGFSAAWFLLFLIPVSNIYPINAFMAEHWMYLPSIGFFIFVSDVVKGALFKPTSKRFGIAFYCVVVLFFFFLTLRQNTYWDDKVRFYEHMTKMSPRSSNLRNNLGLAYLHRGRTEEALESLDKAVKLNPFNADAFNNMGNAYVGMNNIKEAKESFGRAIEIDPAHPAAYNNLGSVYKGMEEFEKAKNLYERALELNPRYAEAYGNLAYLYQRTGDIESAIELYGKAIESDPERPEAYNGLGVLYFDAGKKAEAIKLYEKALSLSPFYVQAYNNLGNAYLSLGKTDKAIYNLRKAVGLDPDYAKAHGNLAVAYIKARDMESAVFHYDIARKLGYVAHGDISKHIEEYKKNTEGDDELQR